MSIEQDYKDELNSLCDTISVLSARERTLREEFQQVCQHPNVDHQKQYYSGGYDYSARTHHTYTCKDCGKYEFEIENHNSGFE